MKLLTFGAMAAVSLTAFSANAQYAPDGSGEPYCREYTQTTRIAGKPQTSYGTACMQPDGSWQMQSAANTRPPVIIQAAPAPVTYYAPVPYYYPPPAYYPRPYYYPYSSVSFGFVFGGHGHDGWHGHR